VRLRQTRCPLNSKKATIGSMATESTESNVDLVRRGYEAYAERDLLTILSLFDPEIEIVQTPELPWGGHYRGLSGVKEFITKLSSEVDALPAVEYYVPAGDDVAAVGRLRGRTRKSGKEIDIPIVHVWTVREGRIARFAAYIDTPAMKGLLAAGGPSGNTIKQ